MILSKKPHGLSRLGAVAGVAVLVAQPFGTLHPLRYAVYNLGDVIPNMESIVSLVNVTALMTCAGCNGLVAHNSPIVSDNATVCNGTKVLFRRLNLCYVSVRSNGEVAEWLMAPVLKTGIPERVSGVRIPPSPPDSLVAGKLRALL